MLLVNREGPAGDEETAAVARPALAAVAACPSAAAATAQAAGNRGEAAATQGGTQTKAPPGSQGGERTIAALSPRAAHSSPSNVAAPGICRQDDRSTSHPDATPQAQSAARTRAAMTSRQADRQMKGAARTPAKTAGAALASRAPLPACRLVARDGGVDQGQAPPPRRKPRRPIPRRPSSAWPPAPPLPP